MTKKQCSFGYQNYLLTFILCKDLVTTVAGSSTGGYTDGIGTAALFSFPSACALYQQDTYVLVGTASNIRKIVYSTWTVTTLAGRTSASFANGVGSNAGFSAVRGITVTTDGSMAYIADYSNHRIRRLNLLTANVTTFAGSGTAGPANGIGTNAQFSNPFGIALHPIDNSIMLVVNTLGRTIVQVRTSNALVSSFAGVYALTGVTDGPASQARLSSPYGISFHPTGTYVVIVDNSNYKIRRITYPGAFVTTLAGSSYGYADGTGTSAKFGTLGGISIDAYGNYAIVTDMNNNNLRKVVLSTAVVTTFAGIASTGGGRDGAANIATFRGPMGVCFSQYDNAAVVTEFDNNKLRLIQGFEPTPLPTGIKSKINKLI
jgi:hypothetical protein